MVGIGKIKPNGIKLIIKYFKCFKKSISKKESKD